MSATRWQDPFACIVLAAGAGSRFGEPKAAAKLQGGSADRFIDAVVRTAAQSGASPIFAVVQPGLEVPAPAQGIVNADSKGEPIASVRLALPRLLNTDVTGVLLWPVDHPFVELTSVLAIVDGYRRSRGGAKIVVPTLGGRRGHPAFFARDVWLDLMTVTDGGARAVVHTHAGDVREIAVRDNGVLQDIDTRSDLPRSGGRHSDALS